MSFSHQISMGVNNLHIQNAAAHLCLDIKQIKPELAAAIFDAAYSVAIAEPMEPDTWYNIDLTPFAEMGKKHRKQWEADTHRQKSACSIRHATGSSAVEGFNAPFFAYQMSAHHFRMKAINRISEFCADNFKDRTTKPGYIHERHTFPPLPVPNSVPSTLRIKIAFFTTSYRFGQTTPSFSVASRYYSREYRAELLRDTGLVTYEQAMEVLDAVYVKSGREMLWQPVQQDWNLGASLHSSNAWRSKTLLIALACLGSFRGAMLWDMFRQVLVQGNWPWLRRFPKTYARLSFLAMTSIFAAMRHGATSPNVGELLMRLASRLVDDPDGNASTWIVRSKELLDDPKVAVILPIPPSLQNTQNEQVAVAPTPWTMKDGTQVMELLPKPAPAPEVASESEPAINGGAAESKPAQALPESSAIENRAPEKIVDKEPENIVSPIVAEPPRENVQELPGSAPAVPPKPIAENCELDATPAPKLTKVPEVVVTETTSSSEKVPEKSSDTSILTTTVSTTETVVPPEPAILPLPIHVVPSFKCNHPVTVPFNGRLKLAHSIQELEKMADSKQSIVAADTRSVAAARNEVIEWVTEKRIVSVWRGDNRCAACAYRLCHTVGGVVVIL